MRRSSLGGAGLVWVALDALPDNTIPYVRQAIQNYQAGEYYSEFGWQ